MIPITIHSVAWQDDDAVALRAAMAAEINERYADRTMAGADTAALVVADESVAYTGVATNSDNQAIGHIALRWLGKDLEIKRMYVTPAARGTGVAVALLGAAEHHARSLGAARLILHTGDRQPEAVRLYEKSGYTPIPTYPPYTALTFSRCFAKQLITTPACGATTPPRY